MALLGGLAAGGGLVSVPRVAHGATTKVTFQVGWIVSNGQLRVPSSLPFLFSALKIASSMLGAIVGEWIGADLGLGALIIEATHNFRSPLLYAAIFLASGWAVVFFAVIDFIERRVITWKPGEVD